MKEELEATLNVLAGKGKGKRPKGAERKKMWDEVKVLRKEWVFHVVSEEIEGPIMVELFTGIANAKD